MTIRDMEIFVKVAEYGHMNAAAEALFISASSVSQTIHNMEQEIGTRLFDRLNRKLYLTSVGETVLIYVQGILNGKKQLALFVENLAEGQQKLRVGATLTVGTCVLPDIVLELRRQNIEVNAIVENTHYLEQMLLKNDLDIALVEGWIHDKRLIAIPVIHDELVVACHPSHPFSGMHEIPAEELAQERLILREKGSGTRDQLVEALDTLGLECNIGWSCSSPEAIKLAVMAGLGVTVISKLLIRKEVEQGELWCCSVREIPLQRTFDIVYHKNKHLGSALQAFIAASRGFKNNCEKGVVIG
ncbi:MAG: LysR family transcriptional regulator [Oscillospiraceae bacterium]